MSNNVIGIDIVEEIENAAKDESIKNGIIEEKMKILKEKLGNVKFLLEDNVGKILKKSFPNERIDTLVSGVIAEVEGAVEKIKAEVKKEEEAKFSLGQEKENEDTLYLKEKINEFEVALKNVSQGSLDQGDMFNTLRVSLENIKANRQNEYFRSSEKVNSKIEDVVKTNLNKNLRSVIMQTLGEGGLAGAVNTYVNKVVEKKIITEVENEFRNVDSVTLNNIAEKQEAIYNQVRIKCKEYLEKENSKNSFQDELKNQTMSIQEIANNHYRAEQTGILEIGEKEAEKATQYNEQDKDKNVLDGDWII